MIINVGTQERVINETTVGPGTTSIDGSIRGDSLLASLYVDSLSSGTLTVSVYTQTDDGKEVLLLTFPVLSGPTSNLLLSASGIILQRFRVQAVYTGICTYEVYIRAITGVGNQTVTISGQPIEVTVSSGDVSVEIQPPSTWQTNQVIVTSTTALLIPAVLFDRKSLLVKNWSNTTDVYIGESAGLTSGTGYPLSARDALAIDLAAGSAIYAVTASGTADIRIVQAGS